MLGRENVEGIKQLEVEDGRILSKQSQPVGKPVLNLHLSDEDVSKNKSSFGFDNVSELLRLESRSKFQETILNALLLYSRSTREKDLAGRLVYMLVALESVLLKNDSEPVGQNVGERMAFVRAKTVEKRRAVIRNLKDAYTLRSKFIHHGHTIDELETVRSFMLDVWIFFSRARKGKPQLRYEGGIYRPSGSEEAILNSRRPPTGSIHPTTGKVNSANFACTGFSETNFCQWILGNQEGMRA